MPGHLALAFFCVYNRRMKRPIIYFAVCLAAGKIIAEKGFYFESLIAVIIISLICIRFRPKLLLTVLLCFLFGVTGAVRLGIENYGAEKLASMLDGHTAAMTAKIINFSDGEYADAFVTVSDKRIKTKLRLDGEASLKPGDIIKGKITLTAPIMSDSYTKYIYSQNTFMCAYASDFKTIGKSASPIYMLRRYIADEAEKRFSGDTLAFYNAVILGNKTLLSDEVTENLRTAGLSHIAVVSGMHISIMLSVIMLLINALMGKRRAGNILAIAAVIFITMATGAGASIVRACIMCVMYQISQIVYKDNDSLNSLGTAVLLMMLYNPYIIDNAGFVLSVLSTLGIILYGSSFTAFLRKALPKTMAEICGVSLSAQITVLPASMYYFHCISTYAVLSNMIVFIFSTVLVVSGLLFVLLSKVIIVSSVLEIIVEVSSGVILSVSKIVSLLPFATVNTGRLDAAFLIVWTAFLASFIIYRQNKNILKYTALICCVAVIISVCGRELVFLTSGAQSSSVACLSENTAIAIGCCEFSTVKSAGERLCAGKFAFAFANKREDEEFLKLIQTGKVQTAVLCPQIQSKAYIDKVKNAAKDTEIIELNQGEPLCVSKNTSVSYVLINADKNIGVIVLETPRERFISLEGLSPKEYDGVKKDLCGLNADYYRLPPLAFNKNEAKYILKYGKIVDKKEKIFLKG